MGFELMCKCTTRGQRGAAFGWMKNAGRGVGGPRLAVPSGVTARAQLL